MSKFNKSDFPLLFATVTKVLGEDGAEKQLSIAYESSGGRDWDDGDDLACTFFWEETEQGYVYWEDLCDIIEALPYE